MSKKRVALWGSFLLGVIFLTGIGWIGCRRLGRKPIVWVSPMPETPVPEKIKKLEAYKFENLAGREYRGSEIKLEKVLGKEKKFTSYLFSFESEGKRITGWANIPGRAEKILDSSSMRDSGQARQVQEGGDGVQNHGGSEKYPVVVMLRGYVDREIYKTGMGTWKAAGVFAKQGYITLAPDFLGYGGSDPEDNYPLLARFKRPVTVLDLLASIESWPMVDKNKVFLWAHSNGGQIALAVLEIAGANWPTTLWAPVSAGFPESILYYAKEMPDGGEYLRGLVRELETYYLPERFSIDNYFYQIEAPVQIHQGTADEAVPAGWSRKLAKRLKSQKIEVRYYEHPGEDHNFSQGSWNRMVAQDWEFFDKIF